MPDRFLNHYACPRCHTTWDLASDGTHDDRCPGCDSSCTPQSSDDLDPAEPIRVRCEVVMEVADPTAVLAHARTQARFWGFDADWEPSLAEAVYEVFRSGDDLIDHGLEVVTHGHRIVG
jgi:hypothetical protein